MVLKIVGKPYTETDYDFTNVQDILVNYNHRLGLTTINVNVDIVTLGIALTVLQAQFDEYIVKLPETVSEKIKTVVKDVLKQNG